MAHYSIYGGALDLDLPETWDDRSVYTFVAPEQSLSAGPTLVKTKPFRPNVVVTRDSKGKHERLDAYVAEQLAVSQKQLPQMKVLREEKSKAGGVDSIVREFTFAVPQQAAVVQQLQIFALSGDWIYTVTFSSLPQFFDQHRKMFEEVLSKINFKAV